LVAPARRVLAETRPHSFWTTAQVSRARCPALSQSRDGRRPRGRGPCCSVGRRAREDADSAASRRTRERRVARLLSSTRELWTASAGGCGSGRLDRYRQGADAREEAVARVRDLAARLDGRGRPGGSPRRGSFSPTCAMWRWRRGCGRLDRRDGRPTPSSSRSSPTTSRPEKPLRARSQRLRGLSAGTRWVSTSVSTPARSVIGPTWPIVVCEWSRCAISACCAGVRGGGPTNDST
jgi:hypothetical protein